MRLALTVLLLSGACVVMVNPPEPAPLPVPEPVPVPVPVERKVSAGPPVVVTELWLFRIDRGTANLADTYARLVDGTQEGLLAAGFEIGTLVVGSLYEPRLLWANGVNLQPPATLADTLRFHAGQASGVEPKVCPTDALAQLGASALTLPLTYPAELEPPAEVPAQQPDGGKPDPGPTANLPLSARPDALLIFLVDTGPRPLGYRACQGLYWTDPLWLGRDPASWLSWLSVDKGARLALSQIRLVFLATAEGITSTEQRQRCLATADFPHSALDSIEASPVPFFDDLSAGLNNLKAGLVLREELCEGAGGKTFSSQQFMSAWIQELQKKAP